MLHKERTHTVLHYLFEFDVIPVPPGPARPRPPAPGPVGGGGGAGSTTGGTPPRPPRARPRPRPSRPRTSRLEGLCRLTCLDDSVAGRLRDGNPNRCESRRGTTPSKSRAKLPSAQPAQAVQHVGDSRSKHCSPLIRQQRAATRFNRQTSTNQQHKPARAKPVSPRRRRFFDRAPRARRWRRARRCSTGAPPQALRI